MAAGLRLANFIKTLDLSLRDRGVKPVLLNGVPPSDMNGVSMGISTDLFLQ